jgi:hypothetical protein
VERVVREKRKAAGGATVLSDIDEQPHTA